MANVKNLLSLLAKTFLLTFFIIVQGCDDDNEPKDTTAPEIAFTDLQAGANVWNTVPIALDATDNDGISLIEIFVDGSPIASLTEAPFETSWDSNLVTDGTHTIKVVVTDKSGNKSESEVSVVVKNALVTIDIAPDQLFAGESFAARGFVFLSDENGNIIASQEYFNGEQVVLKNPGFNGDKFFLTEVKIEERARLWTYPDIERGANWVLIQELSDDVTPAGQADLTLKNATPFTNYTISSDYLTTYANESTTNASVMLLNSPSKLYISATTMAEGGDIFAFGIFSDVIVGANPIDLSRVSQPFTTITAAVPADATYLGVSLAGFTQAGDYSTGLYLGSTSTSTGGGSLDIRYPGAAFASYFSSIELETPAMYYARGSNSQIFEIKYLTNDVSMTFDNNALHYSTSGDFDFLTTYFENVDQTSLWHLILPEANDGVVPSLMIPEALQTFDLPVLGQPMSYVVYDFDEMTNYDGLKTFIRTSTRSVNELYDDGVNYIEAEYAVPAPGGRMKPLTGKHSLRMSAKK